MTYVAVPSPNFNARRASVDMLVLHYTGMETGADALARMCDPAAEVSAHYMVAENGTVFQLVDENERAWHAGVSAWQGVRDLNSCSIGIEIVNGGHDIPLPDGSLPPYPDVQIAAVIDLCRHITARHKILPSRILGHSDIAPHRKRDPGEHFPWQRLARAGIGLWPDPPAGDALMGVGLTPGDSGPPVRRMQAALQAIGYGIEPSGQYDAETQAFITAFQRHWQPAYISGVAGWMTIALIERVRLLCEAKAVR